MYMNKLKETMKKELTQKQKIILSITVAIYGGAYKRMDYPLTL